MAKRRKWIWQAKEMPGTKKPDLYFLTQQFTELCRNPRFNGTRVDGSKLVSNLPRKSNCPISSAPRPVISPQIKISRKFAFSLSEKIQLYLIKYLDGVLLVNSWPVVVGISTERNGQQLEKAVHAGQKSLRSVGSWLDWRLTLKDDDAISQICGHDEIVLDDERRFLGVQNKSNRPTWIQINQLFSHDI